MEIRKFLGATGVKYLWGRVMKAISGQAITTESAVITQMRDYVNKQCDIAQDTLLITATVTETDDGTDPAIQTSPSVTRAASEDSVNHVFERLEEVETRLEAYSTYLAICGEVSIDTIYKTSAYEQVTGYYKNSLWTESMVRMAHSKGYITQAELDTILSTNASE